jgi:hypothetical protein
MTILKIVVACKRHRGFESHTLRKLALVAC